VAKAENYFLPMLKRFIQLVQSVLLQKLHILQLSIVTYWRRFDLRRTSWYVLLTVYFVVYFLPLISHWYPHSSLSPVTAASSFLIIWMHLLPLHNFCSHIFAQQFLPYFPFLHLFYYKVWQNCRYRKSSVWSTWCHFTTTEKLTGKTVSLEWYRTNG